MTIQKYIYRSIIIFLLLGLTIQPQLFAQEKKTKDPFSQKSFLPDISFIFDFALISRNIDNAPYSHLSIPGAGHSHDHAGHGHSILKNGFNLNYGELTLFSAVDPYFDLFATFHLSEAGFEIEEAYVRTQSIPFGFQFKIGKFLSGFGRINAEHAHYWRFFEIPLIFETIFGDHGLLEKGVQVNWVAPMDFYLMLGMEVLGGTMK